MTIVSGTVVFWLVVLSVHDLHTHRLPNRLTMPVVVASIAMGCSDTHVALSIVALAAPYVVTVALGGCGGGDLKLAVGLGGLIADPTRALLVLLVAASATLLAAGVRSRTAPQRGVAHGPALAAATIAFGGTWV